MSLKSLLVQVGEAVAKYLANLPASEREGFSQGLIRFAHWFGWERQIGSLSPAEIEEYAQRFPERLESLRAFLHYAKRGKLTQINLAVHLKVRKPAAKAIAKQAQPPSLTPEGYERFKEELKALEEERGRLIEAISRAREDKDFRENAPLQAARERLGQITPRIYEIEEILRKVKPSPTHQKALIIGHGSKVFLKELETKREVSFQLVYPQEANFEGKISINSPVGKALLGKRAGEIVEVKAPAGILRYSIEKVE